MYNEILHFPTYQTLFVFPGSNCSVDIDECESDPCQNNATCTDLPSGYLCQCPQGWYGTHCNSDVNLCLSQVGYILACRENWNFWPLGYFWHCGFMGNSRKKGSNIIYNGINILYCFRRLQPCCITYFFSDSWSMFYYFLLLLTFHIPIHNLCAVFSLF